ncbi:efflux transporter outer membrane subunit [Pseudomonas sp. SDO524_S393]
MVNLKSYSLPVLLVLLAGCTVGPDFSRPETTALPQSFTNISGPNVASRDEAADYQFWRQFNDPQLTELVEQALSQNYDLRTALANFDAANALLRAAKFDQIPTVTMSADAGHQRLSSDEANGTSRSNDVYSHKASLSWELDFFGRVRRSLESKRSEVEAKASDLKAIQVVVVSNVATTYIDLRAAQRMLELSKANAVSQRQTLDIVKGRLDAGRGSTYELSRAQAQLDTTLARIPQFEVKIAIDKHRLAVLTGMSPASYDSLLPGEAAMPSVPETIKADTPANVIRRRPDVASAEHTLHAATAQIGVTTADLFPRVTLGAAIGTYAFNGSSLYSNSAESNLTLLGIDWSFLDAGRVKSRIEAADAEAAGRLANYQQTVLMALEDVENAIVGFSRIKDEDARLTSAAVELKRASDLAGDKYRAGAIELSERLDVQRELYSAQIEQTSSQARNAAAAVNLFISIAGGWSWNVKKS